MIDRTPILSWALLACALTLTVAGPGASHAAGAVPDSILATYDGGVVTPTEFTKAWWNLAPSEYPPGDAIKSRQTFLSSVVDRKLIAQEALKRPLVLTPPEAAEIERQRELMVQNGLFAQMTKDLPPPTSDDLDRLLRQLTTLADVRLVRFHDMAGARLWYNRLTTGTPASALDRALEREGAKLAEADTFRLVMADQLPDTLSRVIWSLRPGQVSSILEFRDGPTLIQVRGFQPLPNKNFQESRSDLEAEYQKRQLSRVRERFRLQVVQDLKRTYDEDGMAILLKAYVQLPPRSDIDSVSGMPIMRATIPLPKIAPADTSHALVRAGGRTYTIGDYMSFWSKVQAYTRPEVRDRGSLEGTVDRIALGDEITRRGFAKGLDKDPRLLDRIAQMKESFALDHWYRDEIQSKVKVEDSALRKLFDKDPGHYDDKASIFAHIISVDRRSLADSLLTRLKGGASFSELAKTYSNDGETGPKGGDAGQMYRGSQTNVGLEDAMFATAVGEVGGPERTPQGWVLWRIDAKTPAIKRSFEDAHDLLERDFRVIEAERILNERLVKLRKEMHVKLYAERVTADLGKGGPWD
jgi:hypothetical protein